jgi:hypothetical protein
MKTETRIANAPVPKPVRKLCEKRTEALVRYYGKHIDITSIQTLAQSCYLQGAEDAMTALNQPARP